MRFLALLCSRLNRLCYSCSIIIPLSAVYALITWAWITFSFTICLYALGGFLGIILAIVSSLQYIMVVWSYTSACFTLPGSPIRSHPAENGDYSGLPQFQVDQPTFTSVTVKDNGTERYCQKCQCKKPDRTHHCRSCGRCVLKMDHHCPWLATCIGFHNHKQFVLFLLYVSTWCISMFIVDTVFLWDFFTINLPETMQPEFLPINWVILEILSGMVGLVVGGFGAWHVSLVLRNYTTIELMEETRFRGDQTRYLTAQSPKDKFNIFNLTYMDNWTQVMGDSAYEWFLPRQSNRRGDGHNFTISDRARERLREQQSLHSFERDRAANYQHDHRYQLSDFRESMEDHR